MLTEREFWLSEGRNEKKHTKEEEVEVEVEEEVVLAKSKGRRYLFIISLWGKPWGIGGYVTLFEHFLMKFCSVQ